MKTPDFLLRLQAILFPKHCPGCEELVYYNELFCPDCRTKLKMLPPGCCPFCGAPRESCGCSRQRFLEGAAAVYDYHAAPVQAALASFKFRDHPGYDRDFACGMTRVLHREFPDVSFSLVVPVPMTRRKEQARGYNQSALLARCVASDLKVPFDRRALRKTRENSIQHSLPKEQRRKNVQGVYQVVDAGKIRGKMILLIDDVLTTGATLEACAAALRQAGAAGVYALVFAAALLRDTPQQRQDG